MATDLCCLFLPTHMANTLLCYWCVSAVRRGDRELPSAYCMEGFLSVMEGRTAWDVCIPKALFILQNVSFNSFSPLSLPKMLYVLCFFHSLEDNGWPSWIDHFTISFIDTHFLSHSLTLFLSLSLSLSPYLSLSLSVFFCHILPTKTATAQWSAGW